MAGRVARMGQEEVRSALLGKPEGKNPFGHAWGYNIEMNLKEILCEGVEWINLV